MEESQLSLALHSLAVFRPVLREEPVRSLAELLDCALSSVPLSRKVDAWGAYAASLLPWDRSLEVYLQHFLSHSYNRFIADALAGRRDEQLESAVLGPELEILRAACTVSDQSVRLYVDYEGALPSWRSSDPNLLAQYQDLLATVPTKGFGVLADAHMFTLHRSRLIPAASPDPIRLDELHGYEWQRGIVTANVRALLRGEPASDMLLYGDSGTGKSSTIKAVANELWPEGLRLVEVRVSQLHAIPSLLERISDSPLHFILFIDDLSFTEEDDNFRALKGILEGSVLCRARNTIVCATSNRRRLIRETFSDRAGDDVHANETVQQLTALSDRFGLAVPFMDPGREEYLTIVRSAAKEAGLDVQEDLLSAAAERFAIEKGGRSGRAARQFVDQIKCGLIDPAQR